MYDAYISSKGNTRRIHLRKVNRKQYSSSSLQALLLHAFICLYIYIYIPGYKRNLAWKQQLHPPRFFNIKLNSKEQRKTQRRRRRGSMTYLSFF